MSIFYSIFFFILGICWGSFLNVLTYRIPLGENIAKGRSHCTNCETTLKTLDLIPIFSFLFLKGKCRYCKTKISWRYPLYELLVGLLFLLIYRLFSLNVYAWLLSVFVITVNIVIAKIDWDTTFIPNSVSYPSIIIAMILTPFLSKMPLEGLIPQPTLLEAWIGGAVYFAIFFFLFIVSGGGMGMGDAKWALFMGLMLGWKYAFIAFFIGSFTSVLFSMTILLLFRKKIKELPNNIVSKDDEEELPIEQKIFGISIINGKPAVVLGPFLALGMVITWLFGVDILNWWLLS